jgi:adenine-specific DNA-methyltransferase
MRDRLSLSMTLMKKEAIKTVAIDDTEMVNLSIILENAAPDYRLTRVAVVHNPKGSITKDFNRTHEYALFITPEGLKECIARSLEENEKPRKMRRWGENSLRVERRPSFYPIYVKKKKIVRVGEVPEDNFSPEAKNVAMPNGEIAIWPIDQDGVERRWNFGLESIHENLDRIIVLDVDGQLDLFVTHEKTVPKTVWSGGEFDAGNYGNTLLINMLGAKLFDFPKSINLLERCVSISTEHIEKPVILDYFGGSGTTGHAVINLNREKKTALKFTLVEMGGYFDRVTRPRIEKAIYSKDWKDGKPVSREGVSNCFKYIRLESYEDALNNLAFREDSKRTQALAKNDDFRREYMLNYWLEFETKGSPSLLSVEQFSDPTAYKLKIKKPGSDEYVEKAVDLIETFNWLIGLHVDHIDAPRTFGGKFKREADPELPNDQTTRLILDGKLTEDANGKWWFRKVEGRVCRTPGDKKNMDKVLVIWRKLTGNLEEDNLMLDEWFRKYRLSAQDTEFDLIYVNGSNNLPNLKRDDENWKVRLIEESFHQKMWDVEG